MNSSNNGFAGLNRRIVAARLLLDSKMPKEAVLVLSLKCGSVAPNPASTATLAGRTAEQRALLEPQDGRAPELTCSPCSRKHPKKRRGQH
jgi:hypothetical protein